ncbi:MAG: hypothetical protein ACLGH6_13300, partial [Gammaproteobacteria bacterium]
MEKIHNFPARPGGAADHAAQAVPQPGQPIEHADALALMLTSHRSLHGQPAAQRIAGQQRRPQESPAELARR